MLQMKASAGVSWPNQDRGSTIGEVIHNHTQWLASITAERIRVLVTRDLTSYNATELLLMGANDPCTVNIKEELHNKEKIENARYRLITPVSIVDQLCERFFSQLQAKTEIRYWKEIPSKPGMGFSDESVADLFNVVVAEHKRARGVSTDASGWDWSCKWRDFLACGKVRCLLSGVECDTPFGRGIINSLYCLMTKFIVFSDGTVVEQMISAMQKSGSYYTSQINSLARFLCALRIGSSWAVCAGDDSIEGFVQDVISLYKRQGKIIKVYQLIDEDLEFEFCSQLYHVADGKPIVYPMNSFRQMMKFVSGRQLPDQYEQLVNEWRHLPNRVDLLSLITEANAAVKEQQ